LIAACGGEKAVVETPATPKDAHAEGTSHAEEASASIETAATDVATEVSGVQEGISLAAEGNILISRTNFEGRSQHVTTGFVNIVRKADGYYAELQDDFSLDGAPDPVLGFGTNGEYVAASKFSSLKSITGAQSYKLGEDFNPEAYDTIFVWCEKFSVPLGVASL